MLRSGSNRDGIGLACTTEYYYVIHVELSFLSGCEPFESYLLDVSVKFFGLITEEEKQSCSDVTHVCIQISSFKHISGMCGELTCVKTNVKLCVLSSKTAGIPKRHPI